MMADALIKNGKKQQQQQQCYKFKTMVYVYICCVIFQFKNDKNDNIIYVHTNALFWLHVLFYDYWISII